MKRLWVESRRREGLDKVEEDDVRLIQSAKQRDPVAFATIVRNYQHFVYRTAYGVLQNADDAQDVAQETFLKVYQSLSRLKEARTFPTWVARITVRTALDYVARRNRHTHASLDETALNVSHEPFHRANLRMDLNQALKALDVESRTVLILRELHGLDYDAMAEVLQIPTGTVKSRLHRARSQLRRRLSDDDEQGGDLGEL